MVDLPSGRIESPERAFSCVGLDFAGPLTFKNGYECVKGYVPVFVWLASKAVHLEAVSLLTSDVMVAALRRHFARRGIPSQIVSDNATNLVGARRDLIELEKVVQAGESSFSSIEWLFIPPRPPNFRGLSVDDVVLITDDDIPPWSIGRKMQLKFGHDGLAQIALVRTSRGDFTRPISKLRRLPVKDNDLHNAKFERHAHKV